MKSNRTIRKLVSLVGLTAMTVLFGTMTDYSQKDVSKEPDNKGSRDLSRFLVVDYNAPESKNAVEREERKQKNKRYDNRDWVSKNPHPETTGRSCDDCISPPPAIPVNESNLVIIGEIISAGAFLSNDKKGIYTEYEIRIDETLKVENSNKIALKDSINADRAGGSVRYSSGRKVFYQMSEQQLPRVGSRYLLFLNNSDQSPNYNILVAYELINGKVYPLDDGQPRNLKETDETEFVKKVREAVKQTSKISLEN